jgi:hypothetical protein
MYDFFMLFLAYCTIRTFGTACIFSNLASSRWIGDSQHNLQKISYSKGKGTMYVLWVIDEPLDCLNMVIYEYIYIYMHVSFFFFGLCWISIVLSPLFFIQNSILLRKNRSAVKTGYPILNGSTTKGFIWLDLKVWFKNRLQIY